MKVMIKTAAKRLSSIILYVNCLRILMSDYARLQAVRGGRGFLGNLLMTWRGSIRFIQNVSYCLCQNIHGQRFH